MKILPLVVEGIENKVKKILLLNDELRNENNTLKEQVEALKHEIDALKLQNDQLKEEFNQLKVAKSLSGYDTDHARQKINEMLREIQKCYALLNR